MANSYTADQALLIGDLGKSIKARQDKISQIQAMITAGDCQISQFTVVDPSNAPVSLIIDVLDAPTSQAALQYALNVYQTQLTALQTELAAL